MNISFTHLRAVVCRSPSSTLVIKQQEFDLSTILKEQMDRRGEVHEIVGSILNDLLEGLEVMKARPSRGQRNYRARPTEGSDEEVIILSTREEGELPSSGDDKQKLISAPGVLQKNNIKSFAIARSQSRQVLDFYATLQQWRSSKSCR